MTTTDSGPKSGGLSPAAWAGIVAGLIAATAAILLLMGRTPICTCGTVKLWIGEPNGPDNSQHLLDWYSASHLIHGLIFYGLLVLVAARLPLGARLAIATVIEAAWEILENSPLIIDRYRTATMAADYYGDSVLNSVSDILCMVAGFFLARRLPVSASVVLALFLEALAASVIRDNLTLNVLMLLWPVEAVKTWQAGG